MVVACSFLPAATSMIRAMGLEAALAGVTFECPVDKPRIVRSRLEGFTHSSGEINEIVAASMASGESLYYIDMELLQDIAPDVVFTQHVCDVCQVGTSIVERAVFALPKRPEVVALIPHRLPDVFDNALTIAQALGHPERGTQLVEELQQRLNRVSERLRAGGAPTRRVMLVEWLDPIYGCGHWIPDQIALAGGVDLLGNPGGYSTAMPWEQVLAYDPEVLVVAPCGFTVERARHELTALAGREGWSGLTAVRNGAVYVADGELFTQPCQTLVDGVELLASLFHPDLFPERPKSKTPVWLSA